MPHESFRNSSGTGSERASERASPIAGRVRFGAIDSEHVKRIVRRQDADLFGKYFADAVAARWAKDCERDRIQMAALFHQVVRIGRSTNLGGTIAAAWKNRDAPNPERRLKLAGEDEDFARQLLRPPAPKSATGDRRSLPALQSAVSPFDPDDYAGQQARRIGNIAALAAMAGR